MRPPDRRVRFCFRRAAAAPACALTVLFACRSAPSPLPSRPTGPDGGGAADARPEEPPSPQPGRIAADVGGTAVVALDAPAFAQLPREQRLSAYWVAQAAAAGDPIALDQGYAKNLDVVRLVRGILSHPEVVQPQTLSRMRAYARLLWLNGGIHDAETQRKVLPPFTAAELRAAALAAQAAGADLGLRGARLDLALRSLESAIFDPRVDARRISRAPGLDPLLGSAVTLYQGVSLGDVPQERAPLQSRMVREGGRAVEQPYKVGGLYGESLSRVAAALEQAGGVLLAAAIRSGDPEKFRAAERAWADSPGPVDVALGFLDTSADPRGQKALFAAVAGIADPSPPAGLATFAGSAPALAEQLFGAPSTPAAATPLLAIAAGGSFRPLREPALTVPIEPALRRAGRRALLFAAAEQTAVSIVAPPLVRALAAARIADDLARCLPQHRFAWVALRELIGQNPPREDPSGVLGVDAPAAALARADLAAHALALDRRARPLFRDAGCQALYPEGVALWWTVALSRFPEDGAVDGHGQRALALQLSSFTAAGAIAVRSEGGRHWLEADPDKFTTAARDLFRRIVAVETSGDAQRAKELFEGNAMRIDLRLRDETAERLHNLPRSHALLPPVLRPVTEGGTVVDAQAVRVDDLDAEIVRAWSGL